MVCLLDQAITDIRQHIAELRTPPTSISLTDGLTQLVYDSALNSLVEVNLNLELPTNQLFLHHQVRHVLAIGNFYITDDACISTTANASQSRRQSARSACTRKR